MPERAICQQAFSVHAMVAHHFRMQIRSAPKCAKERRRPPTVRPWRTPRGKDYRLMPCRDSAQSNCRALHRWEDGQTCKGKMRDQRSRKSPTNDCGTRRAWLAFGRELLQRAPRVTRDYDQRFLHEVGAGAQRDRAAIAAGRRAAKRLNRIAATGTL